MAPVSGGERAPTVTDEAEDERQIERDRSPEVEGGDPLGGEVQAVLEEEDNNDDDKDLQFAKSLSILNNSEVKVK